MVVIQIFFTIFGVGLVGYFIGTKIDPEGDLSVILAAVGLGLGVFASFMFLYQYIKSEDRRNERRRRD